jgi:lipopolysaccharide export system protein LptC
LQTKGILYLGVLTALAILSRWFLVNVESSLRGTAVLDSEAPLLYIDDFVATRMNSQGIREYTLTAPHLIELSGQRGTQVQSPKIEFFKNGQAPEWLIRAERGWISPSKDVIRLEDAVTMFRPPTSGKQPVVINTRDVLIRPADGYAETAAAARAETPGGVVTATGLKAYLHEERMELLSAVRGYYEQPKP